jgi:predicted metalloprotease
VAVVLLGVLGIALVGVAAAASKPARVADAGYSGYSTYTHSAEQTTTTTTVTTTTTTAGTITGETRSRTSTSASTSSKPRSPRSVVALGDHPLLNSDTGANSIGGCALPDMDYSPAGQEAFLRAALLCIETEWKPVMQYVQLPYQPVELEIITADSQYPCGTVRADQTARYCKGTIYWPALYYAQYEGTRNHPGKYLGQVAHEYGHHIQWLSGILTATDKAQYDKGGWDTPAGLDINRRVELEATCFGGMSLAPFSHGAIPMDVVSFALQDAANRGDSNARPPDHGNQSSNNRWVNLGYSTNKTANCNTWLASTADVA